AGAVEMLPRFLPDRPDQNEALRATGTDGKHAAQHVVPSHTRPHSAASACTGKGVEEVTAACHNPLQKKTVGRTLHQPASACTRVGEGTRTPDFQIHSLTL